MINRTRGADTFLYAVAGIVTLFFVTPLLWVFSSAFKTRLEIFTIPPVWFPSGLYLANFQAVLDRNVPFLLNSMIVTLAATAGVMLIAIPAAFALSFFGYKRKKDLEIWVLSTRMMPPIAAAVPLFLVGQVLGLVDTRIGLILLYVGFNLPFAIWLLTSFFRDLPGSVLEAAIVDGASWGQVLRKIVLPLSSSGISTVAIFTAIFSWNELLLPLFFTNRQAKTFSVVLTEFQGQTNTVWEQMSAAVVIQVIPVVVLTLLAQRYIVSGLTLGAVKE
ncbi:MAG: carbohydrate ABC transporter permease [Egibacteraceae bacterium]